MRLEVVQKLRTGEVRLHLGKGPLRLGLAEVAMVVSLGCACTRGSSQEQALRRTGPTGANLAGCMREGNLGSGVLVHGTHAREQDGRPGLVGLGPGAG